MDGCASCLFSSPVEAGYMSLVADDTEGLFDDIVSTVGGAVSSVTKPVSSIASGILKTTGLGSVAQGLLKPITPVLRIAEQASSLVPGVNAPIAAGLAAATQLADRGRLDVNDALVKATRNALPAPARVAFDQGLRALKGGKLDLPGMIGLSAPAQKVVRALANTPETPC